MAPKVMTDAQRIAFETNGFLTIPNALTPEELSAIRAEAEQAEKTWDANPGSPGFKKPQLWEIIKPMDYSVAQPGPSEHLCPAHSGVVLRPGLLGVLAAPVLSDD